jgi:CheY-like chemotaxis protein
MPLSGVKTLTLSVSSIAHRRGFTGQDVQGHTGTRLAPTSGMQATSDMGTMGHNSRLEPKPWCVDSRASEDLAWVLLIDDDLVNTRALSRWVKTEFAMATRSARTIHQADCWLRSMPAPRAIITDFDLVAEETGAIALSHFRDNGIDAPAVVVTGAPMRAQAALCRADLGQVPVLSKTGFHEELRLWMRSEVLRSTGAVKSAHAG